MSGGAPVSLLAQCLAHPGHLRQLDGAGWTLLIAQARRAGLVARLRPRAHELGSPLAAPPGPARHLQAGELLAKRQYQETLTEIEHVAEALRPLGCPVLLLKGAAYVALDLPVAHGRPIADIDIMVPRARIGEAESALMQAGWLGVEKDPYNQRYYRRWMHEVPPMRHMRRRSVIDLHHTILPPTAQRRLDAALLFDAAAAIPGIRCTLKVLAPADMILHSATHLFHEGEFERGLRDLVDLDGLLRHLGAQDARLWDTLVARAHQLDLLRPLYYALRHAHALLDTPIPPAALRAAAAGAPPAPLRALMDALFARALDTHHPSRDDRWTPLARWLLFVRSHWLRMPAHLLIYHLTRKSFMRVRAAREAAAGA